MDFLRRLLVTVLGIGLSIFLSIIVMIKGWGLEPKSYFWIIGIGVFGQVFASYIVKLGIGKK